MRHSKVQQTYSITTYSSSNECQSEDDKMGLRVDEIIISTPILARLNGYLCHAVWRRMKGRGKNYHSVIIGTQREQKKEKIMAKSITRNPNMLPQHVTPGMLETYYNTCIMNDNDSNSTVCDFKQLTPRIQRRNK